MPLLRCVLCALCGGSGLFLRYLHYLPGLCCSSSSQLLTDPGQVCPHIHGVTRQIDGTDRICLCCADIRPVCAQLLEVFAASFIQRRAQQSSFRADLRAAGRREEERTLRGRAGSQRYRGTSQAARVRPGGGYRVRACHRRVLRVGWLLCSSRLSLLRKHICLGGLCLYQQRKRWSFQGRHTAANDSPDRKGRLSEKQQVVERQEWYLHQKQDWHPQRD